jgi:TIR domain/AAA ATPase domain
LSLIFISHSSRDNAAAEELRDRLRQQGHSLEGSLFLDFDSQSGIRAGQNWEQTLYRNIRACRAVIILCSADSMKSRWCFMEITHARALGKNLFPVKIEDCEVDGILTDHQIVDLTRDKEEGYRSLLRGIAEAGLDSASVFVWDGKRPPYPGLLAFQEEDAPVFFGREDEIAEGLDLLNRVRRLGETQLVMVLGASGSGKSSVVRAGLLPRLRRDVERWLVVNPFRPQNDPALALAEVLSHAFHLISRSVSAAYITARIQEATVAASQTMHGQIVPGHAPDASYDALLILQCHKTTCGKRDGGPQVPVIGGFGDVCRVVRCTQISSLGGRFGAAPALVFANL